MKGIYIGSKFPDLYGSLIDVRDNTSFNQSWEIKFCGEKQWHYNMYEEDFELLNSQSVLRPNRHGIRLSVGMAFKYGYDWNGRNITAAAHLVGLSSD